MQQVKKFMSIVYITLTYDLVIKSMIDKVTMNERKADPKMYPNYI